MTDWTFIAPLSVSVILIFFATDLAFAKNRQSLIFRALFDSGGVEIRAVIVVVAIINVVGAIVVTVVVIGVTVVNNISAFLFDSFGFRLGVENETAFFSVLSIFRPS